jgi:hypothetical protein
MSRYVPIVSEHVIDAIAQIHERMAAAGASDDQIAACVWEFWLEAKKKLLH